MKKIRAGIISLGCPRNLVDSELIAAKLKEAGCCVYDEIKDCDVAVINTCAFIEEAKREAIDIILQAAALKNEGRIKKLIVCGCLSQRYKDTLEKKIPEIDAILGIDAFKNIDKALSQTLSGKHFLKVATPGILHSHEDGRLLLTPSHYAYLKIADGCRNRCSYCAIYKIRGDFRSRPMGDLLKEVKALTAGKKISELNIIAQDTTSYGSDIYSKPMLPSLLKKICRLKIAHWIRLLYTHPKHFTDELIDTIAQEQAICKYIDLPIQHISDRILKSMNRGIGRRDIEALISKIRKNIPGVALRTSTIVGFPGESDKDFNELLEFLREVEFERLGAFIYSREEDTPAYNFKGQVSDKLKRERFDRAMLLQQDISGRVNERLLGKTLEVLIDEAKGTKYIGRTEYDAPEVDGIVYVNSKRRLKPGDFIRAKITDTLEYDLVAEAA